MSQMLINKFQHRQKKAKEREEWARRNEGHWRCPFFTYCWEEGIKLPTAENCPKCNRAYNNGNSSKRVCFDDRRPAAKDLVDSTIIGSQFMIGWGAKPASMISWGPRPVFMSVGRSSQ
jgi:hypothetical protein